MIGPGAASPPGADTLRGMNPTQVRTVTREAGLLTGSALLRIVDPCYVADDGSIQGPSAEIITPEVVRWYARTVRANVGYGWGERNLRLELVADGPEPGDIYLPWEEIGGAAVDSGTICAWPTIEDGVVPADLGMGGREDPRLIDAGRDGCAQAVEVTSGVGDGWYPVEVRRSADGARIRMVRVVFINEDEIAPDADETDVPF